MVGVKKKSLTLYFPNMVKTIYHKPSSENILTTETLSHAH